MTDSSFQLAPGRVINRKYEVVSELGEGWEGEVYLVRELATGIERAAKIFYPKRNPRGKKSTWYAKKLHKLRDCEIIIQYSTQEQITIRRQPVAVLISEFIEGEILSEFLERQPGKRLHPFEALHLLHALASGMEDVHRLKEYHGDLHSDNVIVHRAGLRFDLKLLDLYKWEGWNGQHIKDDVVEMIRIFYEALGGQKHYAKLPQEVKDIICGLKRGLIIKKFKTAGALRSYLENMEWG